MASQGNSLWAQLRMNVIGCGQPPLNLKENSLE